MGPPLSSPGRLFTSLRNNSNHNKCPTQNNSWSCHACACDDMCRCVTEPELAIAEAGRPIAARWPPRSSARRGRGSTAVHVIFSQHAEILQYSRKTIRSKKSNFAVEFQLTNFAVTTSSQMVHSPRIQYRHLRLYYTTDLSCGLKFKHTVGYEICTVGLKFRSRYCLHADLF